MRVTINTSKKSVFFKVFNFVKCERSASAAKVGELHKCVTTKVSLYGGCNSPNHIITSTYNDYGIYTRAGLDALAHEQEDKLKNLLFLFWKAKLTSSYLLYIYRILL